jgi:cytochrome c5
VRRGSPLRLVAVAMFGVLGAPGALAALGALWAIGAPGTLAAVSTAGAPGPVPTPTAMEILLLRAQVSAQELPQGRGRDAVVKRCVACHEADLISQQRLTRAAWGRSVDKMVRWGAIVEAEERDPMLDYLAAHFAPRRAASHIVATASYEGVYKRACLMCHDADLVESQRLTRAGWVRTVDKMIRWGAIVADADKEGLVDYLTARYPVR